MILEWNGKFIITHVGTLQKRDTLIFQECLNELSDKFWYIEVSGVSHSKAIQFMQLSDALLCVVSPQKSGFTTPPSKIYEYMRSGKPVIYVIPGDYKDDGALLVEKAMIGWVCKNTKEDIKSALTKLIIWATEENNERKIAFVPEPMVEL
jgi:hypothetical protein